MTLLIMKDPKRTYEKSKILFFREFFQKTSSKNFRNFPKYTIFRNYWLGVKMFRTAFRKSQNVSSQMVYRIPKMTALQFQYQFQRLSIVTLVPIPWKYSQTQDRDSRLWIPDSVSIVWASRFGTLIRISLQFSTIAGSNITARY